jgi:hypothetical protein
MRPARSFIICRDQNRNRRNINHRTGYIYFVFVILILVNEGLIAEIIGKLGNHK